MSAIIWLIDQVLIHKGEKTLKGLARACGDPRRANEELLMRILKDNAQTEYGRKYDFENIRSADEYRKKVPFSDYDVYEPYIRRMIQNREKDLITAYSVIQYAETSGSVGVQKKIPVTDRSMAVYEKYSFSRTKALADRYHRKHSGRGVPCEKGLNMLETETTVTADGTPTGSVTGAVSRRFRKLYPIMLTSPDPILFPIGGMNMNYMKARFALEEPDLAYMFSGFMTNLVDMMNYIKVNWEMIVDDIEHGTLNKDVCTEKSRPAILPYIKANPKRAAELRKVFQDGFDTPVIPRLWPKISWAFGIGTGGFATYTEKFRKYAGEEFPIDFFVYAASEGIFAACVDMNDPRFVPLLDSCFFEFLPADAPEDCKETLLVDQLEEGKEYEVIVTNQCGFYRYRIKDVIRVVGMYRHCPMITFAYRKSQLVNVAAEKTTEEHLNEAVRRTGKDLNCEFNDYALYIDDAGMVSRYVLLLEPDQPIDIDRDGHYADLMEKHLCEVNPEYEFFSIKRGSIAKPLVLIQQPQTHALWREMKIAKGSSPNQVKPVRVLDVPMKQKFFFGLLEDGQEIPDWNRYDRK